VASVTVLVDGNQVASATLGISRPVPDAPTNTGFQYSLDTTKLSNGRHSLGGTGVFLFGYGVIWFKSPGIFTLLPFSDTHRFFNIFFRASIVIGVILAAYGMLVWRSVFRKLSLANYIIVLSCAPVLLLCVSKMTEWVYFLDQQRGFFDFE